MTQTQEENYLAMATLCGAELMQVFSTSWLMMWPYTCPEDKKMLYGYGETPELAAKQFLERNGLLP